MRFKFHRYTTLLTLFRLTIPLGFAIAFAIGVVPYLSWGPVYKFNHYSHTAICKEYGWRNLIYVNNFYPDSEAVS